MTIEDNYIELVEGETTKQYINRIEKVHWEKLKWGKRIKLTSSPFVGESVKNFVVKVLSPRGTSIWIGNMDTLKSADDLAHCAFDIMSRNPCIYGVASTFEDLRRLAMEAYVASFPA